MSKISVARLRKLFHINPVKESAMKLTNLAVAIVAVFTFTLLAPVTAAWAGPRSDCIATCKGLDKSERPACFAGCPKDDSHVTPPTPMTVCPDGSKVPKGTKCPEAPKPPKCKKGEVLRNGKCVPKHHRSPKCKKGEVLRDGKCVPKGAGGPACEENEHADANGTCVCDEGFERFPASSDGSCVAKCGDNERRDDKGECKPVGACDDPCAIAAAKELVRVEDNVEGMFGDLSFWLKVIVGELGGILLLLLFWFFGAKEKVDEHRKRKAAEKAAKAARAARAAKAAPPPLPETDVDLSEPSEPAPRPRRPVPRGASRQQTQRGLGHDSDEPSPMDD